MVRPRVAGSALVFATLAACAAYMVPAWVTGLAPNVDVSWPAPANLDRAVYRFDGATFARAGIVSPLARGRYRISFFEPDAAVGTDEVVAMAPATLSQFLVMRPQEERERLAAELSAAAGAQIEKLFGHANDPARIESRRRLERLLAEVITETLKEEKVARSLAEVERLVADHVVPPLSRKVGGIMVDRFEAAIRVVVADASENYGVDLIRGRFDTDPLHDAIFGIFADRRVHAALGEALQTMFADARTQVASSVLATSVTEKVVVRLNEKRSADAETRFPYDKATQLEVIARETLAAVERAIARDGAVHPVVLAMMRGAISRRRSIDAVVIIAPRALAAEWFEDIAIGRVS